MYFSSAQTIIGGKQVTT